MIKKEVEHNGKKYDISSRDYAYTNQKLIINGEESDVYIENRKLSDVKQLKKEIISAIEEYEHRQLARKTFEEWDGKL